MASSVTGMFNYMADSAESSILRNGKVRAIRDEGGTTNFGQGVNLLPRPMKVLNARLGVAVNTRGGGTAYRDSGTLGPHGFELLPDPLQRYGLEDFDFDNNKRIVTDYYPTCAELVKQATGALQVFAFDHNVRTTDSNVAEKKAIQGGNLKQGPASVVHGDYTLTSAQQRLRDLAVPPKTNDTMSGFLPQGQSLVQPAVVDKALASGGRFGIINVWRNIRREPVMKSPLALCDGQTVIPEDLVTFEIHYADRIGENYFAKCKEEHAWYYYPKVTRDEALLIKQWDSAGAFARTRGVEKDSGDSLCTFSFHSAFEFEEEANSPDRESIEVRCIAVWPPEQTASGSKL